MVRDEFLRSAAAVNICIVCHLGGRGAMAKNVVNSIVIRATKIAQLDLYYSVDPLPASLKQEVLVSVLFFL